MKPTIQNFGGAIVIKQWEGVDPRVQPLGMEFEVREGSPLFTQLMKELGFGDYIDKTLTRQLHPEELQASYGQKAKRDLEILKEDVSRGTPVIRISCVVETVLD